MILKQITINLVILLKFIIVGLEFPQASLKCPTIEIITGHIDQVSALSFMNNSMMYVSGDIKNSAIVSDIRNGKVYVELDSFLSDASGIQQIIAYENGDILALSKTEMKVYNIYSKATLASQTITTDAVSINTFVQPPPVGTYLQPSSFAVAQNITGITGFETKKIHVLIGISTSNLLYCAQAPNANQKQMLDAGTWEGKQLECSISCFRHLKGTNYLALQYGQSSSGQTSLLQYTLVFYDLMKLTPDQTGFLFNSNTMVSNPVASINLGSSSNIITIIQCISYLNEDYVIFVEGGKNIIIYKISEFVSSGFSFTNAIKTTFTETINRIEYINISGTSHMLVGFSSGNVNSFDFSQSISSPSTTATSIAAVSSFSQNPLGDVQNYNLVTSEYILQLTSVPSCGQGQCNFQYGYIDLSTQATSDATKITIMKALELFTIMPASKTIFTLTQYIAVMFAPKNSDNTCPTAATATVIYSISPFSIQINNVETKYQKITSLTYTDRTIDQFLGQVSFTLNSVTYVATVFTTKPFVVSQHCTLNVQPGGGSPPIAQSLQDTSSVELAIFDLKGVKQFQSTSSSALPTFTDNPADYFISLSIDENQNISLVFKQSIIVMKVYLDNSVLNMYTSKFTSSDIYDQAQLMKYDITSPVSQIISFFYFHPINYILIQFSVGTDSNIVSSLFTYSLDWSTSVGINMVTLMKGGKQANIMGQKILQLHYISDINLIITYSGSDILTISFDLQSMLLTNTNKLSDLQGSSTDPSFITYFLHDNNRFILKIQPSLTIQKINLMDCWSNQCMNQVCNQEYSINQPQTSLLSDIFVSNTSGQLGRIELLNDLTFQQNNFVNIFQSLSINYLIMVEKGSYFNWKNDYVKIPSSIANNQYFKNNKVNIIVQSIDSSLTDPNATDQFVYLTTGETLDLESFNYIYLKNIQWISTQALQFINQKNPYLIIDNVEFQTANKDKEQDVTDCIFVNGSYIGNELKLTNLKYTNKQFIENLSFIYIDIAAFKLTLDNIVIQSCTFLNTQFVSSSEAYSLIANNIQLNENVIIKNTTISQMNPYFISAQNAVLNTIQFNNNIIENTVIFGLNQIDQAMNWNIEALNMLNTIILTTKSTQSILIFDGQLKSEFEILSVFTLKDSSIEKNTRLLCDYVQYNKNKCVSETQGSDQSSSSSIMTQVAEYYLFSLDYVKSVTIDVFNDTDNSQTFLKVSRGQSLTINKLSSINTNISTSDYDFDQSSLIIINHYCLTFSLTGSTFQNKQIKNSFVLQITSSAYPISLTSGGDGSINILNTSFNNIILRTLSSFYRSSAFYIQSLQYLAISITQVTFDTITLFSPEKLFQSQASSLLLDAPFSSFEAAQSQFLNLNTYSPSAALYANVDSIVLEECNFQNNNFNSIENIQSGGFLEVQSNNLTSKASNYTSAISFQGTALTLIPSSINAKYVFEDCLFQDLIALSQGSAIYMRAALNSSQLEFTRTTFNNLVSQYGSGVSIFYSIASKQKSKFYSVYPQVTFSDCHSTNLFAIQGGLLFSTNANIKINTFDSQTNNINKVDNINPKVLKYALELESIGEFLSLESSFLVADKLTINDFSSYSGIANVDSLDIVFLNAFSQSSLTITASSIENCYFYNSGFVLIDSSTIKMTDTNFTNIQYLKSTITSRRILETNINIETQTKFSAMIIKTGSIIDFQNVRMENIICSDSLCSGGAMLILNSGGTMEGCNFDNNKSYSNGGSLSIINLNAPLILSNTYITRSVSQSGNGGGLSFVTNQIVNSLQLIKCTININQAQQGGGIYLEFQQKTVDSKPLSILDNTSVQQNQAVKIGGGIFYQGSAPEITNPDLIFGNKADSSFGQNSFSYPKSLIMNESLSKQEQDFEVSKYINSQGDTVYQLKNQVSGTELPNLIFQLVDENGYLLDSTYLTLIATQVSLNVKKETTLSNDKFVILSSIQSFQFSNYFNITNLILVGVPGTTVFLTLTSDSIQNSQSSYRILLEVQLRNCERGEIFTKYLDTSVSSSPFYKCIKCLQGTYSLEYPILSNPVEECKKCNSNAYCPGGDVLEVNQGYWRINDQTDNIIECFNAPDNCLGGSSNSTCSVAHVGALCEPCDIVNDYTTSGNFQCGSCGDHVNNSLKIVGLMIFYIISAKISVDGILEKLLQMYSIRAHLNEKQLQAAEENSSILLKLILNYFQIIMVLTTFQISIPTQFNSPVDLIANPTTQILYSFECFFYQLSLKTGINMIYIQIISSILLPIVCLFIFFVSAFLNYRNDPYRRSFYLNTSFLYSLMYFQPSIFKNAISVVKCRTIGDIQYIQYNVLFECYTDQYNLWSLSLIVPILLLAALIIPGILMLVIYKSRNNVFHKKKYTFMTGEYRPQTWFWEFIKMYMKLLIMCCLIFYEYDIPNKILFIFFIVSFYGFLLFYYKPYKLEIYNKVDIYQTGIQGVSIYLAFVAFQNEKSLFIWIVALLIIAGINTAFILWSVKLLTRSYMVKAKSQFESIMIFFAKFLCCRKYFFSEKQRKYYSKKRWLKSIIRDMKKRNLINHWTGKLKIDKNQVFPLLYGKVEPKDGDNLNIQGLNNQDDIDNQLRIEFYKKTKQTQDLDKMEGFVTPKSYGLGSLMQNDCEKQNILPSTNEMQILSSDRENKYQIPHLKQKSKSQKYQLENDLDEQTPQTSKMPSLPISPNYSMIGADHKKSNFSSQIDFYPEFDRNDECVEAKPDNKYLTSFQPQMRSLYTKSRSRKESDLVEMISVDQDIESNMKKSDES